MDAWTIYGVALADDVKTGAVMLTILFGIAFIFASVIMISLECCGDDNLRPWMRRTAAGFALALAVATFTPSAKTIAAMYVLPKIVTGEKVQQLGDEAYDLAIEWMKSLKPGKETEVK